jgi:hypothetical protein
MRGFESIFLEFNLPNAATWFYFSLLLAVALFFKFSRLLSVRNGDVLTLFLLVPGLLLLQEAHGYTPTPESAAAQQAVRVVTAGAQVTGVPAGGLADAAQLATTAAPLAAAPSRVLWFGYLWLLCGSAYLFVRCLLDLALVQRPALSPNLNLAGLAWLAGALFICLGAVAARKPAGVEAPLGKRSAAVRETQRGAEDFVKMEIPAGRVDESATSFWVERLLAMLCHLAIVAGLIVVGCRHYQDATAGMAAATFYLLLPFTAYHVEQLHHVWPAALLVWAVAAYRLPVVAGVLLGLAAATVYFPVLLFPVWFGLYWRRGAGRFTAAFLGTAGLCLAVLAAVLWAKGQLAPSVQAALSLSDWQPWVAPGPRVEGFWTGVRWAWAYRLPVAIAYLAFVVTTVFWPGRKNLAHVLALSCAVLLGIQFWYADQGGVYVLWYLPLFLLLVFRPNLADRQPPPITVETDRLARLGRWATRRLHRLLRLPEPAARVH